jgi:Fe-S cluster assembly protein SufD
MTVAVTRTKAEQGLAQNFESVAAKLPGGRAVADVRKAAIGAFASLGLPHRRLEEWKYTDLRGALNEALPPAIADEAPVEPEVTSAEIDAALQTLASVEATRVVFVNGAYRSDLSAAALPKGLEVTPLAQALGKPGLGLMYDHVPGQEAVVALNTAYMTDGAVVRVASKAVLAKPILLVFVRAGEQSRLVTTRNIVQIGAGARASLIEAHVALAGAAEGQDNALSEVTIGDDAVLSHVKVTLAGARRATHLATWMIRLATSSSYRAFHLNAATALTRNTLFATFGGEGANVDLSGVFLGRGTEHIDTTLVVDHAVPGCTSRELFKGVLADRARGVFQGKVIVRPDAQKTDGKQMAQVLMLSEDAEFDSKPELEIHADDVVCGHGSTSAEIDEDLLFYMRARGIGLAEARALLIESFIGEAIDKIEDEALREAIAAIAKARLTPLTGGAGSRET